MLLEELKEVDLLILNKLNRLVRTMITMRFKVKSFKYKEIFLAY
mgnify:CR=1 FL=1